MSLRRFATRTLSTTTTTTTTSSTTSIGAFVKAALDRDDETANDIALVAPDAANASSSKMTYGELAERANAFAAAMEELGYDATSKPLGVRVRNGPEALVAYLGTALCGARAKTCKTREDAREMFGNGATRGTLVEFADADVAGEILGAHEPIAVYGGGMRDKVITWEVLHAAYKGRAAREDAEPGEEIPDAEYFFNSDKPTRGNVLVRNAMAASGALRIARGDSVCVPVPLAHAMGLGFGALAALASGARLVLPPTLGSAADGDAARDAMCAATLDVLRSEKCTLVVADSHVVRAARDRGARADGYEALRGGLTKVGSGDVIGAAPAVPFLGVDLLTVGTPKKT